MANIILKDNAILLRKSGLSYNTISEKLRIPKSTARYWCKHIKLTDEQTKILDQNSKNPFYGKRKQNIENQINRKNENIKKLWKEGYDEIGTLTDRELFLVGIALYWAEGFKKDTQVGFANSDYKMINIYIRWLKKCCKITKAELQPRITINISHKYRIDAIQKFWSQKTNIPESQFRKPFYQNVKWQKQYSNIEDYHGVLRIKVSKSISLLRKIHGWIAGLATKW